MTDRHPDTALDLAARALALVLDLEADDLRADSPLDDLGADSVARIQWADVVEELARSEGVALVVPDTALREAATLGDLSARVTVPTAVAP